MKYTLLRNKVTGERKVRINATGELVSELADKARYNMLRKRAKRNAYVSSREDALRSCGLVKTPYGWE